MANFPILSFEQSNPVLGGYSAVQKIMQDNLISEYQKLLNQQHRTANQYQPQELEEKLIEMRNRNQMDPLLIEQQRIKNQYEPQTLEEALKSMQQKNSIGAVDVQNYPEKSRIELSKLKETVGNPLLGSSGTAGQIGSMLYLKQHPELLGLLQGAQKLPGQTPPVGENTSLALSEDEIKKLSSNPSLSQIAGGQQQSQFDPIQALQNSIESEGRRKNAFADLNTKKANAFSYNSLPSDDKKQLIAQARGLGINADEASRRLSNGESLSEIADKEGFDSKNLPDSIYAATGSDISKAHFREQAMTELDNLGKKVTDAVAPYSERFAGYSPKQIKEALTGENPEKQAKFLAASALMPEIAALRVKVAGGNVGIEAIREVTNASMGHINKFQSLVNPDVYKKANKYVDDWISEAATKANKVWLNQNKSRKSEDTMLSDPLGIR